MRYFNKLFAIRRLHHVDDVRRGLRHQFAVHDRLAPNFLAIEFISKIVHVDISYTQWMKGSLPFALPLLLALPLLTYVLYPPEIKHSAEGLQWAGSELGKMGRISRTRGHRSPCW